jgi:hypothetical protein
MVAQHIAEPWASVMWAAGGVVVGDGPGRVGARGGDLTASVAPSSPYSATVWSAATLVLRLTMSTRHNVSYFGDGRLADERDGPPAATRSGPPSLPPTAPTARSSPGPTRGSAARTSSPSTSSMEACCPGARPGVPVCTASYSQSTAAITIRRIWRCRHRLAGRPQSRPRHLCPALVERRRADCGPQPAWPCARSPASSPAPALVAEPRRRTPLPPGSTSARAATRTSMRASSPPMVHAAGRTAAGVPRSARQPAARIS